MAETIEASHDVFKRPNLPWRKRNRTKGSISNRYYINNYGMPKEEILMLFGHKCFYCKCEINEYNCQIDHYWPKKTKKRVFVASCVECNHLKSNKHPKDFIEEFKRKHPKMRSDDEMN